METQVRWKVSDDTFQQQVDMLKEMVAIPSVSNPNSNYYSKETLKTMATYLQVGLEELNFNVEQISANGSDPYVVAERIYDPLNSYVTLYAHYDVQPVDESKWNTNPFEVVQQGQRLYGRGVSDDKGGIAAIIGALKCIDNNGAKPKFNIRILFEGEEEYGSQNMKYFLQQNAEKVSGAALVVMDSGNKSVNTGTICSATRGYLDVCLKVSTLLKPVHSGSGCIAPDPAAALANIIADVTRNPSEIPGFTQGAKELSDDERAFVRSCSTTVDDYNLEHGIIVANALRGNPEDTIDERIMELPTISVPYMNAGSKSSGSVIQESAECKFNIRLLAGQDPKKIQDVFISYLEHLSQVYNVHAEIEEDLGDFGWRANLEGEYTKKYLECLAENFDQVAAQPTGGTLPLLHEFNHYIEGMELIAPGVMDPDTNAHSFNESQSLPVLRKATDSLVAFLQGDIE